MHRKLFSLFLTLLLVGALAALAQSPTSSNTGGSETKDPYGATLDHPNPGSPNPARPAPAPMTTTEPTTATTPTTTTESTPPAAATPPATSTYNSSTTDNTATTPSTPSTASTPSTMSESKSLPRTASDLPLLVVIGLLALGGALTVRSIARRDV